MSNSHAGTPTYWNTPTGPKPFKPEYKFEFRSCSTCNEINDHVHYSDDEVEGWICANGHGDLKKHFSGIDSLLKDHYADAIAGQLKNSNQFWKNMQYVHGTPWVSGRKFAT